MGKTWAIFISAILLALAIFAGVMFGLDSCRVSAVSPADKSDGAAPDEHISVTFAGAVKPSTINDSTVYLTNGTTAIPTRIAYNAVSHTAVLDALSPLPYATQLSLHIIGGTDGVRSKYFRRQLPEDQTITFTTAASPLTGPGGPILVITDSSLPFSTYYAEILRAEGLNEFGTAEISAITPEQLSAANVVILAEMPLTDVQAKMLADFVQTGGKLIAMRPDVKLDPVMGISSAGNSASDAYFAIDTASDVGRGLTNTSIQYHGPANLNALKGATTLATLYSDGKSPLANPALTLHDVGNKGGQAAAFSFDVARSIVLTREGNPKWAGHHLDGQDVARTDDELLGSPENPWMDLQKVAIPQADQLQHLLTHLIEKMSQQGAPLPRFWYYPNGKKAVVMMSGDDHANNGTVGRWHHFNVVGNVGGQPVRGTSYIFPSKNIPEKTVAPFVAQGFEVALHVEVTPGKLFQDSNDPQRDWKDYADLDSIVTSELADFCMRYPSLPKPITNRTHGVVWSDYASQPQVEFNHGIRLDANYYYWPPTWINDRPGMFTGSGIPMRFADADGKMIDVYQESTVMTDESGQSYPYFVDAILDAATGPQGNYGAFAVNAHIDEIHSDVAEAVIDSCRAHNVPIISAADLLNFMDGRGNSRFDKIHWDAAARLLSFEIHTAIHSDGLHAMVPLLSGNGDCLQSISVDGNAIGYESQLIDGVYYARFASHDGSVLAQYAQNARPLAITAILPVSGSINVPADGAISATFSADVDPAKITFNLKDQNGVIVPSSSSYDAATHIARLIPRDGLRSGFVYNVLASAIDRDGHGMIPQTWNFTTASATPPAGAYSLWDQAATPDHEDETQDKPARVGMQFTSDVAGTITHVRFYKGPNNTGDHTGRIWSSDGKILASAAFTNETPSGWQTAPLDHPVHIDPGAIYVVSYHCESGRYSFTSHYFDHRAVTSGPLHAPASDTISGGNGVFALDDRSINNEIGHPTSFPNQTFHGTNYWVDVVFEPAK